MTLPPSETSLFFKLMLPLQFFANEKLNVFPQIKTLENYVKLPLTEKFEARKALFANVELFDRFIDENPYDISMKELTVVSRWKKFVEGDFSIERYTKDYAVFISDDTSVYEVYSLTTPLTEYFPKYALPIRLKTILLPFQDKIVTDGFFLPYPINFGSGFKLELREIYMAAKREDKIIRSL